MAEPLALFVAYRAVQTNLELPGRFSVAAAELAFAIGNGRRWVRVNHTLVARDAGIALADLRLLVRAMVGDGLIERHEGRAIATPQGYRKTVYLRSAVGDDVLDLLRAVTSWAPDWRPYLRCRPPRPPRLHACPHCGSQERQIVTSCMGCGAVLAEVVVHGDGEPPG